MYEVKSTHSSPENVMDFKGFMEYLEDEANSEFNVDAPWKKRFMEKFLKLATKSGLLWLKICGDLDSEERSNKKYQDLFFKYLEHHFYDSISEISSIYEFYEDKISQTTNKLRNYEEIEEIPSTSTKLSLVEELKLLEERLRKHQEKEKTCAEENVGNATEVKVIVETEDVELEEDKVKIIINQQTPTECVEQSFTNVEHSVPQQDLKETIENLKTELTNIWDKVCCGANIKSDFPCMHTNIYNYEVLNCFKKEIFRWQRYYEKNKNIFQLLKEHESLVNELNECQLNAGSDRLYRNRRAELLRVTRQVKCLTSKIYKKEEHLFKLGKRYFQNTGEHFWIFGETLESYVNKRRNPKKKIVPECYIPQTTPKTNLGNKNKLVAKSTTSNKNIRNMPTFKLRHSVSFSNEKKGWAPSRVSLKLAENQSDDSECWIIDYTEFETDIQQKQLPRSSEIP